MTQHFLLSSAARTLSLARVMGMSDQAAEAAFARVRWAGSSGEPVCPKCGCLGAYDCRRPNGAPRYRCKACRADFSITSGTLFASHKLPLRGYLAAIAVFCNEVKGKSMLALSRDLGTSYKAAFVLAHKLREAMASEIKAQRLGGVGKAAEIDGAYFGGYIRPANEAKHRRDRRLLRNQNGKRQCVVVIRERDGRTLPGVFPSEQAAVSFIRNRIAKGTEVHADESGAWNALHGRFVMKRINHKEAYSLMGACTNEAESFFSRIRRGEIGHHHHIPGIYLGRYAQESAWREDHRRDSNGEQVTTVAMLAMRNKPSVDFSGYWQRHRAS
jgi:transposase-like protein